MARKIVKIFISLLFLAVAAVAALFAIKTFLPSLSEQPKYGVKPVEMEEIEFIEEETVDTPRPVSRDDMTDKYGVAPIRLYPRREDRSPASKYGVAPVRLYSSRQANINNAASKYGVEPIRRRPYSEGKKYGVAPVVESQQQAEQVYKQEERRRALKAFRDAASEPAKYGVAPIEK